MYMDVQTLLQNAPMLHQTSAGAAADWRIDDETIFLLDTHLKPAMRTLETGAGISTLVFGMKHTKHTCIVPDRALVDRIVEFATTHDIPVADIEFVLERSELALPAHQTLDLDLVLIDGRHGFPSPFIDWFFCAMYLRVGGMMIIDDMRVWTCSLLVDFLRTEPEWRVTRQSPRMAVVEKLAPVDHTREWNEQLFVLQRSRNTSWQAKLRYAFGLFTNGKWDLMGEHFRNLKRRFAG